MAENVRCLNERGVEVFGEYLHSLRDNPTATPPYSILSDPLTSANVRGRASIENHKFATRMEAGKYLNHKLSGLDPADVDQNRGLWAWLSLFYFDMVCPLDIDGEINPGQDYRHIPVSSHWHFYRHLLLGPFSIYRSHGESAKVLLANEVSKPGNFNEQIASRADMIRNPAIIQSLDVLYYDETRQRAKKGAEGRDKDKKPKAGTLLRFVTVIDQLTLNFDLFSVSRDDIVELLPREFNAWRPSTNVTLSGQP